MPGPVSAPREHGERILTGSNAARHQRCYGKGDCAGPGCALSTGKTETRRRRKH
jgi:hypothetical protein